MKIRILAEDVSATDRFRAEHGLSIYIETSGHRILFDLGASGLFAENASKMGVDLSLADTVVISHGHYDHGGGLGTFFELNERALVYINKRAFDSHCAVRNGSGRRDIGLENGLKNNGRIIFTDDQMIIDSELELFSDVRDRRLSPLGNKGLFSDEGGSLTNDDFTHEQNLVVKQDGVNILFTGCAHKGIVNILEHMSGLGYAMPKHILGGFHLQTAPEDRSENLDMLEKIGAYLKGTGSRFYTCHCTGLTAYKRLKEILGSSIIYISTGTELII